MIAHANVGSKALGDVHECGEDREWQLLCGGIEQPFGGVVSVYGCIRVDSI